MPNIKLRPLCRSIDWPGACIETVVQEKPREAAELNFEPWKPYISIGMKYFSVVALALFVALTRASSSDYSENVLQGIKGVGLNVLPLTMRSNRLDFDTAMLGEHASHKLEDLQVPILTGTELDRVPGRPFLEIGVNIAHAQGPSHLYTVSLRLREMAALERPTRRSVSMALSTWERESMGVANRPEAILETVDRMLTLFSEEFHKSNTEE